MPRSVGTSTATADPSPRTLHDNEGNKAGKVTSGTGADVAMTGTATSVNVPSSFALATIAVVVFGRQPMVIGWKT
jgi:hypothetical protein